MFFGAVLATLFLAILEGFQTTLPTTTGTTTTTPPPLPPPAAAATYYCYYLLTTITTNYVLPVRRKPLNPGAGHEGIPCPCLPPGGNRRL